MKGDVGRAVRSRCPRYPQNMRVFGHEVRKLGESFAWLPDTGSTSKQAMAESENTKACLEVVVT